MSNDIIKSYKTNLTNAETKLNMVLNEMIKSYPNYKLYPDVNEIQNIHENNTFKLEDIKKGKAEEKAEEVRRQEEPGKNKINKLKLKPGIKQEKED